MMQIDTMVIELHSDVNTLVRVLRFEANTDSATQP